MSTPYLSERFLSGNVNGYIAPARAVATRYARNIAPTAGALIVPATTERGGIVTQLVGLRFGKKFAAVAGVRLTPELPTPPEQPVG